MSAVPIMGGTQGGVTVPTNTTTFVSIGGGAINATEANRASPIQTAGTLDKLQVMVQTNGISDAASFTVTSRKASGAGSMSVVFGSTETGTKTDVSNSDTFTAGQTAGLRMVTPNVAGSISYTGITTRFSAGSDTVTQWTSRASTKTFNGGTTYSSPHGIAGGTSEAAGTNPIIPTAGTWKNFNAFVASRTNDSVCTITARKNSADAGSPGTVTLTLNGTGAFSDLTNTVAVADGDKCDIQFVGSGTAGTVTYGFVTSEFATTNNCGVLLAAPGVVPTFLAGTTYYPQITGGYSLGTAENALTSQIIAQDAYTLSKLSAYFGSVVIVDPTTFRTRKNGGNGTLAVTVNTGAGDGWQQDLVNSDSLVAADVFNMQMAMGAVGTSLAMSGFSLLISQGGRSVPVVAQYPVGTGVVAGGIVR